VDASNGGLKKKNKYNQRKTVVIRDVVFMVDTSYKSRISELTASNWFVRVREQPRKIRGAYYRLTLLRSLFIAGHNGVRARARAVVIRVACEYRARFTLHNISTIL